MNKRLISVLLVLVMICTLLPLSVMAEESTPAAPSSSANIIEAIKELLISDSRPKVTPKKPSGDTGMVVVPVFGKELTDILEEGKLFNYTKEALQVRLSGKTIIPEVKITISGTDDNTRSIQEKELDLAKYSIFEDPNPNTNVKVQGREAFKDILLALKNHFLENIHTNVGRDALKKFFDDFNIPYEDEDIVAIINNPSQFETNILNVIGRGEYTDVSGKVYKFNTQIGNFTLGFAGLGLTEEDCTDADTFFTALYNKYAKENVDNMLENAIRALANGQLAEFAGFAYQVYVKEGLPAGEYQVRVEEINRQGFTTKSLVREYPVTVKAAEISYAGETRSEGTTTFDFEKMFAIDDDELSQIETDSDNSLIKLFNFIVEAKEKLNELYNAIIKLAPNNQEINLPILGKISLPLVVDFTLDFTGVWLDREDPYIAFVNQDLGGNNIKKVVEDEKAQFVMVDRDELLKLMDAMIGVGKDTFTNVVNSLKDIYANDGSNENLPTWEQFIEMHRDILKMDTTGEIPQIELNSETLLPLVWIYVKMMDIPEVWDNFLAKDVRLPAILMATADDEGKVKISEDSNVTLVWMLDALLSIANISQEAIQTVASELTKDENESIDSIIGAAFEGANLDNPELKTLLVNVLAWLIENTADGTHTVVELLNGVIDPVKGLINKWIYPLLQNDALFHLVGGFLEVEGGNGRMHGILTDKMPDSYYLLFQKQAPEGYMINPMVYTVKLDWAEDGWVYAKVANLGIVRPYFAENYYTFLRNNSIIKTGDKVLNNIFGEDTDVLRRALNAGDDHLDLTSAAIELFGKAIYQNMGGSDEYSSEEALNNDLINYMAGHGRNVQSLMMFANQVALRSKAVVTADLNEDWYFYNFNDTLHTSLAKKTTALLKGVSDSITSKTLVGETTKAVIAAQVSTIESVDNAITQATQKYTEAVKEAVSKAAKSVAETATKTIISAATKVVSSLFSKLFKK